MQDAAQRWTDWRRRAVCSGLLLLHAALCVDTARVKSVTHDEIWHLPVGLRILRTGDFDVEPLNPPLSRVWAAVPAWAAGVDVSSTEQGMALGGSFVAAHPQDYPRWYFLGRLLNIVWSLATGWLVYYWSRRWWGDAGGLLSLLLFVCCPNLIGHASLVTPEAGLVFAFTWCWWNLARWREDLSWKWALLSGLSCGVALAMKFTAILLLPLTCGWLALSVRNWWPQKRIVLSRLAAAAALALVTLAACHGGQGMYIRWGDYQFGSQDLRLLQQLTGWLNWSPVPLPSAWLTGFDQQRFIMESPHPVYLDGVWSLTGFRSYYLMTLLYKLPHTLQAAILGMLCLPIVSASARGHLGRTFFLLAPGALLIAIASREGMQLGVRYVAPLLPLTMIACGQLASGWNWEGRRARFTAAGIGVACLASLTGHPDHLAYFNFLSGGPVGGRQHLLDSNLDWGQDLYRVREEMRRRGIDRIHLAYFGTLDPRLAGIEFDEPPAWRPSPGWHAVSVNYVMGRPHVLIRNDGTKRSVDFQEFGYFRQFQPVETLGGSIDLYEIKPEDVRSSGAGRFEFGRSPGG